MSSTTSVYTIVGALAAIEKRLGAPREWGAATETQVTFLGDVYATCRPEVGRISEIESYGSTSAEELNAFAAGRGLPISWQPFGADEVGAVSLLDLLVKWTVPGRRTRITTRHRWSFPAVRLPASSVQFRRSTSHPAPIAMIGTVSGDTVYLTPMASRASDPVALARRLTHASADCTGFAGIVFPMVDLEVKEDLNFLLGMSTRAADGRPARIRAAEHKSSLKMNEDGARVEDVACVQVVVLGWQPRPAPDFVIDEPFLLWIQRPSLSVPLFVAHVTRDAWRNPEDLTPRLSRSGAE